MKDEITESLKSIVSDILDYNDEAIQEMIKLKFDTLLKKFSNLPKLNYYITKNIYVVINPKDFINQAQLKVNLSSEGVALILQNTTINIGNSLIDANDVLNVYEYGSASHSFRPTGIFRRFQVELENELASIIKSNVNKKRTHEVKIK